MSTLLMKSKRILVWFRNDLRLHDNEMLIEAIAKSDQILPVYFFDPRHFEEANFHKSSLARTRFLLESVAELRASFRKLGGDILIIHGRPETHLPELVTQFEISEVYHHREVAPAETLVSANVEDQLWKIKVNLKHFIGHTLYNKEDLPFPIKDIPDVFTQFKKKTERDAMVKACFNEPEQIAFVENEDWGDIPALSTLYPEQVIEDFIASDLIGGEHAGLRHLEALLRPESSIYVKVSSRNADPSGYISNLSPWLSLGCLSPRKVYWAVKGAEDRVGSNSNFSQLILGLFKRDYFRFMFKKHGAPYLEQVLPAVEEFSNASERQNLELWKNGETGHDMIDGYMKTLKDEGYISNYGRVLTATFLVHVLKSDWTKGAAYFEERLIDYSAASNWGNWECIASSVSGSKSKNGFDVDKHLKILNVPAVA
jgi:deoxyribodipyrimidine photo-lyase